MIRQELSPVLLNNKFILYFLTLFSLLLWSVICLRTVINQANEPTHILPTGIKTQHFKKHLDKTTTVKPQKTIHLNDKESVNLWSIFDINLFTQHAIHNFLASKHHSSWAKRKETREMQWRGEKAERNRWWIMKKKVYFSEHILTYDTDWPASFRYIPLHVEIYSCKNT